jgi:recombination DNA repair RAD52 pathway protein
MAEPVPAGWTQPDADLYAVLTAPFERYHEDKRAGVSFRYITGEQCETRLNQAFGPLGWSFEITDRWVDAEADEVVVQGKLTVYRTVRLSWRRSRTPSKVAT